MARYAEDLGIREALARHFERSGFAADGGYNSRWVGLKLGPVTLPLPNIEPRRVVAPYHDIHHVLTEYDTDWPGEMEIGAWEIATGCAHFWMAWILDLSALGAGAVLQPQHTFRAWCRGRRCRNLFLESYEPLLGNTVGELRRRVALDPDDPVDGQATLGDRLSFVLFSAIGLLLVVAQVVLPIGLAVLLIWLFS